jgi:hypothetical protein
VLLLLLLLVPLLLRVLLLLLLHGRLLLRLLLLLEVESVPNASVAPADMQQPLLHVKCVLPLLLQNVLPADVPQLPCCALTLEPCLLTPQPLLVLLALRLLQHLRALALLQRSPLHAVTQHTSGPSKQAGTTPQQLARQSCSLLLAQV